MFDFQSELLLFYPGIPLTGTFFHYRGPLLNWCPIGRIASLDQRNTWKEYDHGSSIRKEYMELLKTHIATHDIPVSIALGGSTSFDIYPTGWDKTYVMNHLTDYEEVYFIGDKCMPGGNDKTLYDLLMPEGRAYETGGPSETIRLISKIHV